jgi:hypothetical protein
MRKIRLSLINGSMDQWISEQGYRQIGEPRYAGYDAPWVPWPLRRNEVMIPVASLAE